MSTLNINKLLTASLVLYRIKLVVINKQMRKSSELYFIFIIPLYEILSIQIDSSIAVALIGVNSLIFLLDSSWLTWVNSLIFLLDSSCPYLGQLFNFSVR